VEVVTAARTYGGGGEATAAADGMPEGRRFPLERVTSGAAEVVTAPRTHSGGGEATAGGNRTSEVVVSPRRSAGCSRGDGSRRAMGMDFVSESTSEGHRFRVLTSRASTEGLSDECRNRMGSTVWSALEKSLATG
jgi:hypothetical protein